MGDDSAPDNEKVDDPSNVVALREEHPPDGGGEHCYLYGEGTTLAARRANLLHFNELASELSGPDGAVASVLLVGRHA